MPERSLDASPAGLRLNRRALLVAGATAVLGGCSSSSAPDQGAGPPSRPVPTPWTTAGPVRTVRRVSPDGDDNGPGSQQRPWRTLGAALSRLGPGDELVVRGGTYDEDVDVVAQAGTAARPVRVRAAKGQRPLLRGLLWLQNPTWWDIRGIDVTWPDRASSVDHMVKLQGGSSWVFSDAELWGARSFAALAVTERPQDFVLRDLYVHDTHPSNDTNQDHLVYLNCGTGGGLLERSLLVGSPNGRAVKIGAAEDGGPRVANLLVRRCTMVDNLGPSNVQLAYRVSDVTIEDNIMQGTAPGRANVTAFKLKGRRNIVRHNVCWQSSGPLEGEGLTDGGGNVEVDPRLTTANDPAGRPFLPTTAAARAAGRWS